MAQDLLAYISSDVSEDDVKELRSLVEQLARFEWSWGPPQFIDELDDTSCTRPEDEPVRTVGLVLTVSGPGEHPPTPVAEPARIVEALARLSAAREVEFELQLDFTYVGDIAEGVADKGVREGLLARW